MKQETKLLIGKLAFILSKGKYRTPLIEEDLRKREEARRQHCEQLQNELDAEHSRAWGIRAIDGKRFDRTPFTKTTNS